MAKKRKTPTSKHDSQRETRVLLERIGSDVQIIAEQVVSNTAKLAKLDEIDSVKSDLSFVKTAVVQNGRDIKKLQVGQHDLKTGQSNLGTRQSNLETGQCNLATGQRNLEKGQCELKQEVKEIKVKLDTVTENHEKRIQKLETVR